jgi:hypothetical protein
MTHFSRALTTSLVLACCVLPSAARADDVAKPRVRVLAILPPADSPLSVVFITDGEYTRGAVVGGPLMALINRATVKARNEPLAAELNATVEGYDRNAPLADALRKAFAERGDVFDITATTDRAHYFDDEGTGHLTAAAAAEGLNYVLVLDPHFAGLWMATQGYTSTDDLAPSMSAKYRMFRVREPSGVVLSGDVTANGSEKRYYKEAVRDRAFFIDTWPSVSMRVARSIVGNLYRTDKLHFMAGSVGRGDEVPPMRNLFARYAKKFKFVLDPMQDWRETKMATPYGHVLEPVGPERKIYSMRFEVDLLLPELGQDVHSVADYLPVVARNLAEHPEFSPLRKFDDISAPGFESYAVDRTTAGGRDVLLFRKLDDDMMEVVTLVFLKDFDTLYPTQRKRMERMIGSGGIELR